MQIEKVFALLVCEVHSVYNFVSALLSNRFGELEQSQMSWAGEVKDL